MRSISCRSSGQPQRQAEEEEEEEEEEEMAVEAPMPLGAMKASQENRLSLGDRHPRPSRGSWGEIQRDSVRHRGRVRACRTPPCGALCGIPNGA